MNVFLPSNKVGFLVFSVATIRDIKNFNLNGSNKLFRSIAYPPYSQLLRREASTLKTVSL